MPEAVVTDGHAIEDLQPSDTRFAVASVADPAGWVLGYKMPSNLDRTTTVGRRPRGVRNCPSVSTIGFKCVTIEAVYLNMCRGRRGFQTLWTNFLTRAAPSHLCCVLIFRSCSY